MKIIKKISALVLVCLLAISAVGCHKKNEIAVKADGFQFTSAYYMFALINAKAEAQSKVNEELTDEEKQKEVDYFSKKIDGKKFADWVENRALEIVKENATYKSLCKKADLKLDDETKQNAESYAAYYWQNGYSQYFEPNGVSQATYTEYTVDSYYSSLYFEHLYGKDGEKEIPAADVDNKVYDTFITANLLDVTFNEETDEEKAEIENKLNGYAEQLKNKSATFEKIYKEYNGITEENETEDTGDDTPKPKDQYASVLGAKDSGYDHDYYDEICKMTTGEIKVIKKESDAGFLLVVKQDIKADTYYRDNLDMTARHLIKDEEYKKDIAAAVKDLKADVSKYAIGQFKVEKITEPQYN